MFAIKYFFYFTSVILISGCVSTSKHEQLQNNLDKNQTQLKQSEDKINELETLIAELERKLGAADFKKKSMVNSIQHMKTALKEASERKKQVEKRLNEFRKLISRFKSLTAAGELSVQIVDGRMVVALPSDVLFRSGSSRLSNKGTTTVKKVAQLLVAIPEKQYQIEGHTDNIPINSKQFPSNWELASARALNVVKTMIKAGIPESRISAASFADTKPVMANKSKEGRAANRRIDIVVIPDLSKLPGYEELQQISTNQ